MAGESPIRINTAEKFEHLPRAPIVEAVIEFKARSETPWEQSAVESALKHELPDYPTFKSMQELSFMMPFGVAPEGEQRPQLSQATKQAQQWIGFRIESSNGLQIAIFKRDGFSLSRLKPYEDWAKFSTEALRLWIMYSSLARPAEVQRTGVRFINRLDVPIEGLAIDDYLKGLPRTPKGYPTSGFLYRDVLSVPGYSYAINLIRTLQPPRAEAPSQVGLLLDIDVFSAEPTASRPDRIQQRLAEMRILKNRMFFESITNKTLELCR